MGDLDDLERRKDELAAKHRELAREVAEVAEFSAEVHEEAARVHDDMDAPLLDPEQLRAHAQEDRELAARERAVADGE